jgi:hypothetical protein
VGQKVPIPEIVAVGMPTPTGPSPRRPDAAKAFFETCDVSPLPKHDEERREAAAEAMAEVTPKVIAAIRRIERAMEEQASE